MKILSPFLALFFLTIVSCSKNFDESYQAPLFDKSTITTKPENEQIRYALSNLKEIGFEVAKAATNKDFVAYVHNEAGKKFDGEYEVLVKDLFKKNSWSDKVNLSKLNLHLDNFKNIDGESFYPQIYIPKMQHEEDIASTTNNIGDSVQIIYIYYAGESEVDSATNTNDSYPGYIMNAQGQMEYWGMVNEAYANNNEVWIISLNESVNSNGNLGCPLTFQNGANYYDCGPGGGGGGGDNPPPTGCNGNTDCDPIDLARAHHPDMGKHDPVNFRIDYMVVKEHKEHWLAGASEICIRAALNCHNNLSLGKHSSLAGNEQYASDQKSNYLGIKIEKFKRREIRNQTVRYIPYSLQKAWPKQFYASDPVWFDYIIFERDIWPAHLQQFRRDGRVDLLNMPFTGNYSPTWNQWYRSGGPRSGDNWTPYNYGSFVNNLLISNNQNEYYATGFVNNNSITFNTKAY